MYPWTYLVFLYLNKSNQTGTLAIYQYDHTKQQKYLNDKHLRPAFNYPQSPLKMTQM